VERFGVEIRVNSLLSGRGPPENGLSNGSLSGDPVTAFDRRRSSRSFARAAMDAIIGSTPHFVDLSLCGRA
jgi:hypothetical protein